MITFTKMTGAGNDFVVIDNRVFVQKYDWAELAPKICDRRFGIGADGLLVLEPNKTADFTMLYYNADGSHGGMCGNGGRCAAGFVMLDQSTREVSFEALSYIYHAKCIDKNKIQLFMKNVSGIKTVQGIHIFGYDIQPFFVNTGSPHAVIFYSQLTEQIKAEIKASGINRIGRLIRNHTEFFPEGTNVNFVEHVDNQTISMRTYERGVEDETLACGTGAVACAIVSTRFNDISVPVKVITQSKTTLEVSFRIEDGDYTQVSLTGPIQKVFTGVINL